MISAGQSAFFFNGLLDLYVRHTSKFINPILRRLLPLLEPTRNDKTLPKFSNYADLWARRSLQDRQFSRLGSREFPRFRFPS